MLRRLLLILMLVSIPGAALAAPSDFVSQRIMVEVRGRGPDVVLIPGLASTPAIWRATADRLDDRYRVHLVSVRGFGATDPGANIDGLVSSPVASEVRRYMRQEGLTRVSVIGHSMGGQIGLRIAADDPARVSRLMMVDAAPFFPALVNEQTTSADVEPLANLARIAVLFLGDEGLRQQSENLGGDLGGAADGVFSTLGWQGGDRNVLAQGLYEVMTVDLRPRLARITAPVTVVYGWSPDRESPRSRVDVLFRSSFAGLATAPTYERIEGAEHMVMIDQPARFAAAVDRFLRR